MNTSAASRQPGGADAARGASAVDCSLPLSTGTSISQGHFWSPPLSKSTSIEHLPMGHDRLLDVTDYHSRCPTDPNYLLAAAPLPSAACFNRSSGLLRSS